MIRIGWRRNESGSFRSRSATRDKDTDAQRLSAIEREIRRAIENAQTEKKGLSARLEKARVYASVLMGNEESDYEERGAEGEDALSRAENDMISAGARIRQIEAQLAHLEHVLQVLKQGPTPVAETGVKTT